MVANEVDPARSHAGGPLTLPRSMSARWATAGSCKNGAAANGARSRAVRNDALVDRKLTCMLPVMAGKPYHIDDRGDRPAAAESPEAGLYLGDQRIAALDRNTSTLTAELPASDSDQAILEFAATAGCRRRRSPDRTMNARWASRVFRDHHATADAGDARSSMRISASGSRSRRGRLEAGGRRWSQVVGRPLHGPSPC